MSRALGLSVLLGLAAAVPVPAAERTVQDTVVLNADGQSVALGMHHPDGRWTLLVVDAGDSLSGPALSRLEQKGRGWDSRLVIAVRGDESAFRRLADGHPGLAGAAWYRDPTGAVLRELGLPGTPVLLGIREGSHVAWQAAGLPATAREAQGLVRDWIEPGGGTGGK